MTNNNTTSMSYKNFLYYQECVKYQARTALYMLKSTVKIKQKFVPWLQEMKKLTHTSMFGSRLSEDKKQASQTN